MRAWLALPLLAAAILVVSVLAPAPEPPPVPAIPGTVPPVQRTQLKNGLRVITWTIPGSPTAALSLGFPRGSSRDPENRSGLAHFVEHLMFRHQYPDETTHDTLISDVSGYANAFTSYDHTVYTTEAARNQLELLFWLEAHRFSGPDFAVEDLRTELNVVVEEYLLATEQVGGGWWAEVSSTLFRDSCYDTDPHGDPSELFAVTADEVREYCRETHVANGAVLAVAGGVEHSQVVKLAKKYFGKMPSGEPRGELTPPRIESGRTTAQVNVAELTAAVFYPAQPLGHPDEPSLDVLSQLMTTRLQEAYLEGLPPIFTSPPTCSATSLGEAGMLAFQATVERGTDSEVAFRELYRIIDELRTTPITAEEADKAVRDRLSWGFQNVSWDWGRANALAASWLSGGGWKIVEPQHVTPKRLSEIIRDYLKHEHAAEFWVHPRDNDSLARDLGQAIDRALATNPPSLAPPAGEASPLYPPPSNSIPIDEDLLKLRQVPMVRRVLPNGLTLFVLQNTGELSTTFLLALDGGAQDDFPGKPGTAWLAAFAASLRLLSEDSSLASRWDFRTWNEDIWFMVPTLADEQSEAIESMSRFLRTTELQDDEIERSREWLETSMESVRSNPSTIADTVFWGQVMGDHRHTQFGGQGIEANQISDETARRWWRSFVIPSRATIYAVGPEDPEVLADALANSLEGWRATSEVRQNPSTDTDSTGDGTRPPGVYVVDHRSEQVQVRIGYPIPRATSENRTTVLRYLSWLESGLSDGLGKLLRSDHGFTYNVTTTLEHRGGLPFLFIQTATRVENVPEVLSTIRNEMTQLRNQNWFTVDLSIDPLWVNGTLSGVFATSIGYVNWIHGARRGRWHIDPTEHYAELDLVKADHLSEAGLWLARPDEIRVLLVGPLDELTEVTRETDFGQLRKLEQARD